MKEIPFFLLLCCVSFQVFSQKEAAIWYFGNKAGLDFNSGSPVVLSDGQINTLEGCSTISDFKGDLLFYTDGITVWDSSHNPMPNGFNLLGNPSSTQSGIIVPKPDDPDTYYIFTALMQATGSIHYSEVDMTLNGGLGNVTIKNMPLGTTATEKLTAVLHANRKDIWVVAHEWGNDAFTSYKVTTAGVDPDPVVSNVGVDLQFTNLRQNENAIGYIKASPDGSKLVVCHYMIGAELFDFDTMTGRLNNPVQLLTGVGVYGAAFSPSSEILYLNSFLPSAIYQYDLNISNIAASETLITKPEQPSSAMQLAVDGKIYTVHEGLLGVINNPEVLGLGCNYKHNAIDMSPGTPYFGLPPFIQSFFQVNFKAKNFCLGDATEFMLKSNEPITDFYWDFGDGYVSTEENPSHTYAAPGTYTATVMANTATDTQTESKEITIYPNPVASAVSEFEVCSVDATYNFNLSTKDVELLNGHSASDFKITYHTSMADAQNLMNPLPIRYTNTKPVETLYARISNANDLVCFDTVSFDLIVKQAPVLKTPSDWVICDTNHDGEYTFDLLEKDSEILDTQSASDFTINYFTSKEDADNDTNALNSIYTNTTPREDIFFRIENMRHPECFETGSFEIVVVKRVLMNEPSNIVVCDNDNDGFYTFDLTSRYREIINSSNNFEVNVAVYLAPEDLVNRENAVDAAQFTNTVAYSQQLLIRVEHAEYPECFMVEDWRVTINDSPMEATVADWQVCDDDGDGSHKFNLSQKDAEILGNQNISDFTITYHASLSDADSGENDLDPDFTNTSNPQKIYYRIATNENSGCYRADSFELQVFETPMAHTPLPITICDDTGTRIRPFDLSQKDAEILKGQDSDLVSVRYFSTQADAVSGQNPISKTAYTNSTFQETIYARIQNVGMEGCYAMTSFDIFLNTLPEFDLEDTYVICPDSPELVLDGGDFESWSWKDASGDEIETDRTINIPGLGDYILTVSRSQNGLTCEKSVPFEVVSSGAPEDFSTEIQGFSDTVTLVVNASGTGTFEYSIDGEHFQDSNRFEVFSGEYTVYVRDRLLCRTISKDVIALGYRKFFTPNKDGTHEHWNIIGSVSYPESQLYIYDRYGKLLAQVSPTSEGWDGTYRGKRLPASDYWFRYLFNNGKVFTGHFSLKR